MTDYTTPLSTLERLLTVLAELGPATATTISESLGIAYSTTTPKLRELESTGHAERVRTDHRTTLWQLTGTGRVAASTVTGGPQAPTAAPADNDVTADPPQHANPDAGSQPEPDAVTPSEDPVPEEAPATRPDDSPTTATDPSVPVPAEQVGPTRADRQLDAADVERHIDPGSQPGPEPEAQAESPSSDGTGQDRPSGEPPIEAHVGGPRTGSPAENGQPTPALAGNPGTGTGGGDGRRKATQPRRRKGELRDEVLALLRRRPDTAYKVGEICKLLNQANDGAPVNRASAGAVANALDKLVIAGSVTRLDTTVATYQAG